MQVIQNGLALKSANTSWPAVELTVKTDSLSSYTDIAYNEKMTLGLDPSYDAGLLRGSNKLSVYSHLVNDNGLDFAIQCLPENQLENMVVPIGIDRSQGIVECHGFLAHAAQGDGQLQRLSDAKPGLVPRG